MPIVRTVLAPQLIEPAQLEGATVVVIDQLRASTTICAALAAGADGVRPFLSPEDAVAARNASTMDQPPLLGGERSGVLIPGFDLDNSPANYTSERVAGREICFTTTNGTRAVNVARAAGVIVIGCLGNRDTLCARLASDERVFLLCAGTDGRVTAEDVLAAGAIADGLERRDDDDSTILALEVWHAAREPADRLKRFMLASRGGRNLESIGLRADVEYCARIDHMRVVPVLGTDGVFRRGDGR